MRYSITLASVCLILMTCCPAREIYKEPASRSLRDDVDLILIPRKFNVLETSWLDKRAPATFKKQDLLRHLAKHGRTLSDLMKDKDARYTEKNGIVTLWVKKVSHSTAYPYDTNIPILFYGPDWVKQGIYLEEIHQQHIVPTVAEIIKSPVPGGVKVNALKNILLENSKLPDIIFTLVLDQGGLQYFEAHPDKMPNIKKLIQGSAYFPNGKVGHIDTHTAVGHAAIGSGAYPKENNVIGNTFFTMRDGKLQKYEIYARDEVNTDPGELKTQTLADVFSRHTGGKSVIISQSYALRSSIGMGGHGSFLLGQTPQGNKSFIHWIHGYTLEWVTDSRWFLLSPTVKKSNPYENFIKSYPDGFLGTVIQNKKEASEKFSLIMATPAQVHLEGELARNLIQEEIINKKRDKDQIPDLAYISLKATDAAGHLWGHESIEAGETFRAADDEAGKTLSFLEKNYSGRYVFVLTADHGCAPMPELSGGQRYTIESLIKTIDSLLPKEITGKSLVRQMSVGQISLNKELMEETGITEDLIQKKILGIKTEGKPFFVGVLSRKDIPTMKR